ncbi:MAG: hypothetical protein H7A34_07785 [bacterium]|nr:hypothetical protein [bacterium]
MNRHVIYSLATIVMCGCVLSGCGKKEDGQAKPETASQTEQKQPKNLSESLDTFVKDVEKAAADLTQTAVDSVDTERIGKAVGESVDSLKESLRTAAESVDTQKVEGTVASQLNEITKSAEETEAALLAALHNSVEDSVDFPEIVTGNVNEYGVIEQVEQVAQAENIEEPALPVQAPALPALENETAEQATEEDATDQHDADDFEFLDEQAESSIEAIENAQLLPSVDDQVDYLNEQAEMFYEAKKFKEAVDILNHILANLDPDSEEAINMLQKAAVGLGKPAELNKVIGSPDN